jgi:HSP20 family protein
MESLMKAGNGVERNWMLPQFPSLFDDFFTRDFFRPLSSPEHSNVQPAVNVLETPTAYEFEMAAPGMDKKDFKVEFSGRTLFISSVQEKEHEEKNQQKAYNRREFSYRSFSRSFNLPENAVDTLAIKAQYKNGILYVTVPKKPHAQSIVKRIEVL